MLDPLNFQTPITDPTGMVTASWQRWFARLVQQVNTPIVSGLDPNGSVDSSGAINAAINNAVLSGSPALLYFPAGRYLINKPIVFPSGCPPIVFIGDGMDATVFLRGANMPAGQGMFDVQGCSFLTFSQFGCDGQVTVPVGISYTAIAGNPMYAPLTLNSTFWVHGAASAISFEGLAIRHTGGYGILLDPSTGLIQDIRIFDSVFENNRPHLFGTVNLIYGAWTGGIFVNGDGTVAGQNKVLQSFIVSRCRFRRNNGNCLWSHLYGLNQLHSDFSYADNSFWDCGLDGIEIGGVTGGVVADNTFRRVGYVTTDDTSPSVPAWMVNANAVALDSAGLVKGVVYKGNSFTSINGGCMDLDGHAYGAITGNICHTPIPGEPEYAEDRIALTGPNNNAPATYGINVSNTNNDPIAGKNSEICGNTFLNLPSGAIRLYASRGTQVIGNNIVSPAQPLVAPIMIGNIGTGDNQRSYDNVVNHNRISYSPVNPTYAIEEDASMGAFEPTDKNYVFGNLVIGNGNATEFLKAASSGSTVYLQTVWFT